MPGLQAEATESDFRQREQQVAREVEQRVINQVSGANSSDDVHVRDLLPNEDLQSGSDNNWNGTNRVWLQGGGSADQLNEMYTINSDNKAEGKVIGIYAIQAQTGDPNTTEVQLEDGTGSIFERLMFQEAHNNQTEVSALMRNPVIYNEGKDGVIQQWLDNAADDELILHGVVGEKAGTTLGTRSQTESSPSGVARNNY